MVGYLYTRNQTAKAKRPSAATKRVVRSAGVALDLALGKKPAAKKSRKAKGKKAR